MRDVISNLSTPILQREVERLAARLIEGAANDRDIDNYVLLQLELADRELLETLLDPRD